MEYYCLDENHKSGTLSSKFIGCQNQYQLQNLKFLSTIQGHKNLHGQIFWDLNFFYLKRQGYRHYQNKNQLLVTSSSCINVTMKLLIKLYLLAQKQGKSEILLLLCFR